VTEALSHHLSWNDLEIGDLMEMQKYYREKHKLHKHTLAKDAKVVVGSEIWNNYFKFSFVRHPYTRSVSLYTYIEGLIKKRGYKVYLRSLPVKRWNQDRVWRWSLAKAYLGSKSFSEFIRHDMYLQDVGAQPQVKWVLDDDKNMLLDFVGKVENLEQDLNKIVNYISGDLDLKLRSLNVSGGESKKTSPMLSEADYEYLQELYREDFTTFDYDPNLRF